MCVGYIYECDKCSYSVSTSGPWEFYRDSKDKRKPYGHPGPDSKEAKERGIYGFSADLYCPKCDKIFDVVLLEFTEPLPDYFAAWEYWPEQENEFEQEGDKAFYIALVDFAEPLRDYFAAWAGWCEPRDEFKQEDRVKCPECRITNMIWDTKEAELVLCPRCKEGILRGQRTWIA